MRTTWFPVANDHELTEPVPRTLCGEELVLFRNADGRAVALPDRCSHRNAPLSAGKIVDGCIECPYHGWIFDSEGTCVVIPSSGVDATVPPKAHLSPIFCEERYGLIWVALDEPTTAIPPAPWDDDPTFRRLNMPMQVWSASASRMVDNFMDISHFPWVHVGTFGAATERTVAPVEMGPLPDGFHGYAYEVTAANDGDGATASGQEGDVVHREMSTGFHVPFSVRSTIKYETGLEHIIYLLMSPVDAVTTNFFGVFWRNDDFSIPADEVLVFDYAIAAEDKRMLEMVKGPLPLGNVGVVSVQSDRPSVEWKRQLNAWLGS